MTEREARALKVKEMLGYAEVLSMESKRLGEKFAAAGALDSKEEELEVYNRMTVEIAWSEPAA